MGEGVPPGRFEARGPAPEMQRPRQSVVLGAVLVLVGAVLLLGQFAHLDVGNDGWPFFVIVPGILLLTMAVSSRGVAGEGLAILGSITTVTGLILLFQNSTDHFESWAYAWALVAPGSVGIGVMLYGLSAGRPGNVRVGLRLLGLGVLLFILGAAFFEGVIGIGGYGFGRYAGAVAGGLIILLGALLLVMNLASRRPGAP